jgi:hypothetical protein
MKKLFASTLAAAILGTVGCTTMSPEKKYTADTPPPVQKNADGRTDLPPVRLSENRNRVVPEEIDETNYTDKYRLIANDIQDSKPAMAKADR